MSTVIGISCLVLLEMFHQVESGLPIKLGLAFVHTLDDDLPRALPILLVWALLWFALTLIQVFTRRKRAGDSTTEFSPENAARVLVGYRSQFSFSDAFFEAMKKGVRMVVFLILPAIAWEHLWPIDATRRGLHVLKAHLSVFASGFVLTEAASLLIFLPAFVIIYTSAKARVTLPPEVWFGVIIYSSFAWSFTFFIEQMFAAQLYLWHLKWLDACKDASNSKSPLPSLENVKKPTILDDVPEFVKLGMVEE